MLESLAVEAVNEADWAWSMEAPSGTVLVRGRIAGEFAAVHDDSDIDEFPMVLVVSLGGGLWWKSPMAWPGSMS
jgi:hypothetical protein